LEKRSNKCRSSLDQKPLPTKSQYGVEVTEVLRTTPNWKAPRRDQVPNFWHKQLTATHTYLTTLS